MYALRTHPFTRGRMPDSLLLDLQYHVVESFNALLKDDVGSERLASLSIRATWDRQERWRIAIDAGTHILQLFLRLGLILRACIYAGAGWWVRIRNVPALLKAPLREKVCVYEQGSSTILHLTPEPSNPSS
jgi:hypothetical protein